MRKKYTIIQESTGQKHKCKEGEMIVMNPDGVFFIVVGFRHYYTSVGKLSDHTGNYTVVWMGEQE